MEDQQQNFNGYMTRSKAKQLSQLNSDKKEVSKKKDSNKKKTRAKKTKKMYKQNDEKVINETNDEVIIDSKKCTTPPLRTVSLKNYGDKEKLRIGFSDSAQKLLAAIVLDSAFSQLGGTSNKRARIKIKRSC